MAYGGADLPVERAGKEERDQSGKKNGADRHRDDHIDGIRRGVARGLARLVELGMAAVQKLLDRLVECVALAGHLLGVRLEHRGNVGTSAAQGDDAVDGLPVFQGRPFDIGDELGSLIGLGVFLEMG